MEKIDSKTFWFYAQFVVYMLVIIATTIFCYARLDFVRSYASQPAKQTSPQP